VDTSYNGRNRRQTERLRALDRLSDTDLSRPVGEHWMVAVALCHIAHVDERVLAVLELSRLHGIPRAWWTMDEALAVNDARLPRWRTLPPREALRRAIRTAEALDRVIRDLPPEVAEAVAAERPRSLDRSLHRAEHLDEVEQAVGA
jgi:hypothetical protein